MVGEVRKRRLPPLGLLITAEAVARSTSFTAASDQLHVTPSSVSHQVRALEEWLGFALFHRNTRMVTLTALGQKYLDSVSDVLSSLEGLTSEFMEQAGKLVVLRLQTTDSFAARWLVDRLPAFLEHYPDIAVRVVTWEYTEGFRSAEADLVILYGQDEWSAGQAGLLLPETIFPVCSPAISAEVGQQGVNLLTRTLLHDDNLGTTWQQWWDFAQVELGGDQNLDLQAGLHFNHSHLALRAAERGSGVALASWPLVVDALRRNELAAPFRDQLPTGRGYYVVQSPDPRVRDRCRPLCEWLFSEAAQASIA